MTADINGSPYRVRAVMGGDARGDASTAGVNGNGKRRTAQCTVVWRHGSQFELVEPFASHRQADQAASMRGHEVDGLWSNHLGGHRQISFVLAILIVDDDDHSSSLQLANRRCD